MLESAMPRSITLSDETFARLQAYAQPFIDTPEDAIKKVLALAEGVDARPSTLAPAPPPAATAITDFNAKSPPDLTHTKVLSVDFQGVSLPKSDATWNGLLNQVIMAAHKKLPEFADLKKVIHVNMVKGKKEDEGYRYLPQAEVSVQGQDANAAWQTAYYASVYLDFSVEVIFTWRQKEKAAHPGVTGRLFNN
jgi:hypothetical protein